MTDRTIKDVLLGEGQNRFSIGLRRERDGSPCFTVLPYNDLGITMTPDEFVNFIDESLDLYNEYMSMQEDK